MGFLANSMLMRKVSSSSGGGPSSYTITVGSYFDVYFGYLPFIEDGIGSIDPDDGTISGFAYASDGSSVNAGATFPGTIVFNGESYVLVDAGDGTFAYDGAGLAGPYPSSGTIDIEFVPA